MTTNPIPSPSSARRSSPSGSPQRSLGLLADRGGVTDVIGQFLLIGITVGMVATLSFFISSQPPPDDPITAELKVASRPGNLSVEHTWGESVLLRDTRLLVMLEDETQDEHPMDEVGPGNTTVDEGDPDKWDIGEFVCVSCHYPNATKIIRVGIATDRSLALDWSGNHTVGDAPDAPKVDPVADFSYDPSSPVEGDQVDFTDLSYDPDGGSITNRSWDLDGDGIEDATGPNPSYTYNDAGDYDATLTVTDDEGATGSETKTITVRGLETYVTCPIATGPGTVSNCSNARQNDTNVATLSEEDTTQAQVAVYNASDVISDDNGAWDNSTDVLAWDGNFTTATNQKRKLRLDFEDQSPNLNNIKEVLLKARVRIDGGDGDDQFGARSYLGSQSSSQQAVTVPADQVEVIAFNFTSSHPKGNATWSWKDINSLEVEFESLKGSGPGPQDWNIDHAWLEVTHKAEPSYVLDAEGLFDDVVSGSSYTLEIRHRTDGEDFTVQVWNFSTDTWGPAQTLSNSTLSNWTYDLDPSTELEAQDVLVRLADASGGDPDQSHLELAYARVVTTP